MPAIVAVPSRLSLNVTPLGREPFSLSVGSGKPVVVTVNVPAVPFVNVVPFALVIAAPVAIATVGSLPASGSAVVYATFAVILVFFPVLNMSGLAGNLFGPLGVAYIWAIIASLIVALTVTPALSLILLGGRDLPPQEPPLVHWLKRGYEALLLRVERAPRVLVPVTVGLLVVAGVGALFFLSSSFLPELREGNITVHMTAVPGTSLEESLRLGDRLTQALSQVPFVRSVAQRVGRAELGTDTMGTHESEIDVNLQAIKGTQVQTSQDQIRGILAKVPGAVLTSNSFLTERINETLSGYGAAVAVNVFGNDLDQMDRAAAQIARILGAIPGGAGVQLQSPPGMPEILVRLRKDGIARWGFDPLSVLAWRDSRSGLASPAISLQRSRPLRSGSPTKNEPSQPEFSERIRTRL